MTRARCVLGGAPLRAQFDAVRAAVITATRGKVALRGEIVAMRDKVRSAHPVKDNRFDVKHSPGGMVDAEFVVQYLVLAESAACPALVDNVGNIALLRRAEAAGLLPVGVGETAADAYRTLRRRQHEARLNEAPTQIGADELLPERQAILTLWESVLGPAPH